MAKRLTREQRLLDTKVRHLFDAFGKVESYVALFQLTKHESELGDVFLNIQLELKEKLPNSYQRVMDKY